MLRSPRLAGRREADRWGHAELGACGSLMLHADPGRAEFRNRVASFSGASPPARGVLRPQVLLKAFVANLKSSSPTVRRTAAGCAVSVCQHSRRTQYFYSWLLNALSGTT